MLKDVARLGFNPKRYSKKPEKGNILMEFVEEPPAPQPRRPRRPQPSWMRHTHGKGPATPEVQTQVYYNSVVKPIMDKLVRQCHLIKPANITAFACAMFTGEQNQASQQRIGRELPWNEYYRSHMKPATLQVIEPLIRALLAQRPQSAPDFLDRLFRVFSVLADATGLYNDSEDDGTVPLSTVANCLSDALWSISDSALDQLNATLARLATQAKRVHIFQLVANVPLSISEPLCKAIAQGKRAPAAAPSESKSNQSYEEGADSQRSKRLPQAHPEAVRVENLVRSVGPKRRGRSKARTR
mgnify:FL=1